MQSTAAIMENIDLLKAKAYQIIARCKDEMREPSEIELERGKAIIRRIELLQRDLKLKGTT